MLSFIADFITARRCFSAHKHCKCFPPIAGSILATNAFASASFYQRFLPQAAGSSEQCSVVIAAGAVPLACQLMSSSDAAIVEQTIWLLGNIAADGVACRDEVLAAGALPLLIAAIDSAGAQSTVKLSMLRIATWTVSNLCRFKPSPNLDVISTAFPALSRLLHNDDTELLSDCCWAFS